MCVCRTRKAGGVCGWAVGLEGGVKFLLHLWGAVGVCSCPLAWWARRWMVV